MVVELKTHNLVCDIANTENTISSSVPQQKPCVEKLLEIGSYRRKSNRVKSSTDQV